MLSERDILQLRAKKEDLLNESRGILEKVKKEKRECTAEEGTRVQSIHDMAEGIDFKLRGTEDFVYRQQEPLQPANDNDPWESRADSHSFLVETRDGQKIKALRNTGKLYNPDNYPQYRELGIDPSRLDLGKWLRGKITGDWNGADMERRTLHLGSDILGGYLVPSPLAAEVIDMARNKTRLIQAGAITVPMTSETLTVARIVQDPTASWVQENQNIPHVDMQFGRLVFTARKLAAQINVSREAFADAVNIGQIVMDSLSSALALELDRVGLYGINAAGEAGPGLKNDEEVQTILLGGNGAVLRYDHYVQAWQKLLEANCPEDGLSVIMNPRERGYLERMKDGNGNPLTPPSTWNTMAKYSTNQIETTQTQGSATNASDSFVGRFSEFWYTVRQELILEVSYTAADSTGSAWTQHQVWIKATLRATCGAIRPTWFTRIYGIIPE